MSSERIDFAIGFALGYAHCAHSKLAVDVPNGRQMYGEGVDYVQHLMDVLRILREYGITDHYTLISGALHDVREDTSVTREEILRQFGPIVDDTVDRVTVRSGKTRHDRHEATYPLTKQSFRAITVKLADRLANGRSGGKNDMYVKEHPYFRYMLYREDSPDVIMEMWAELDTMFGLAKGTATV